MSRRARLSSFADAATEAARQPTLDGAATLDVDKYTSIVDFHAVGALVSSYRWYNLRALPQIAGNSLNSYLPIASAYVT